MKNNARRMAVLAAAAAALEIMPVAANGPCGAWTDSLVDARSVLLEDLTNEQLFQKTVHPVNFRMTAGQHCEEAGNQTSASNGDLEAAKTRYEAAKAQYDLGSAGFYQYRMDNAKDSDEYEAVQLALAIINDKTGETQLSNTVNLGPYTDPSKEYDAASLENMKAALAMIARSNELRTTDESVAGIKPLLVSDVLMAQAQKNANYADTTDAHPSTYGGGENLAVVTGDPFIPWFHVEKKGFENYLKDPNYDPEVAGDRYSHYLNITEELSTTTGFAISRDPNITNGRTAYVQRFGMGIGTEYSEYLQSFTTYYDAVVGELNEARAAYEAASKPGTAVLDSTLLDLLIESGEDCDASNFKAEGFAFWDTQFRNAKVVRLSAKTQDEIDEATRNLHETWLDLRLDPAVVPLF